MSNDKLREEFRKWLLEEHGLESEWQSERNCFKDFPAHLAYLAWQASRESLVIELPSFDGYRENIVRELQAAFREQGEATGLKVKP
jgi:hypothetical protein